MIPAETISEIRDRTDMVSLVGEHVRLVKRGSNHIGLCPFHAEKTPSFNVSAGNKFFHCFGCKESGDPFGFVMRIEGVTFPEAARQLAERAGVEIPETDRREDAAEARARQRRDELQAVMEEACAFYERQLKEHPAAEVARAELDKRGVSAEIAGLFRLGYAPHAWDELLKHLERKGISLKLADEVGLLGRRRDDSGFYDRFRGRLMFPLRELGGAVVAFSGRVLAPPKGELKGDEPKYVNSPEGPLYHKGQVLYGLHEGRVETRRRDWAILCEGNFDLLALHQAGLSNSMAPLGTAFTAGQAKLLGRFAKRVTLLFDGDAAGLKAVQAAQPILAEQGLRGQVAQLPPGADPDSYLREHGEEGLRDLVGGARGIVEFLIDAAADGAGPSAAERAAAVEALGPILATVKNSVEVQMYIERIAQRFGLSDLTALRRQLRQGVIQTRRGSRERGGRDARQGEGASHGRPGDKPVKSQVASQPESVKLPRLQSDLVRVLLDRPGLFATPKAGQLEELLAGSDLHAVYQAAHANVQENGALDVPALLSELEGNRALPQVQEWLAAAKYQDRDDAEEVLNNGVLRLAKQDQEDKGRRLLREIQAARMAGDHDRAARLTKQRDELVRSTNDLLRRKR